MSTQTLPAWIYQSEEFLKLERAHFLENSWTLVCHVSDIPNPGDYQTITLFDEPLFVIRTDNGGIRGFYNLCRHRAAKLLDGAGNCGNRILCPYHAWGYDPSGVLTWVPFEDQYADLDKSEHALVPVDTEVYFGFVFVRTQSDGESVAETLRPIADELSLYRLEEVVPLDGLSERLTRCNWKNGTDNYVDALHVKLAHPGLNSLLNTTYTLKDLGDGHSCLQGQVENVVGRSEIARRYHEVLPDVDFLPDNYKRRWLYFMIWPNLAFNLYPDQVEFMQFLPIDATHTLIRFGNYALPDARPEMAEARQLNLDLNAQVGEEDTDLIERVQVGMASGSYQAGPLGENEVCLRAFADHLRALLPVAQRTQAPEAGTIATLNRNALKDDNS